MFLSILRSPGSLAHMRKSPNESPNMKSHNQTKEEKLNLSNFQGTSTEHEKYEDYLWHLDPVLCHVRRLHRTSWQLWNHSLHVSVDVEDTEE